MLSNRTRTTTLNPGSIPKRSRDQYFAEDALRDEDYQDGKRGDFWSTILQAVPSIIENTGVVSFVNGTTILITELFAWVKDAKGIVREIYRANGNYTPTFGADGTYYIKVAYAELETGSQRNKVYEASTYYPYTTEGITITTNTTAPTVDELCLGRFIVSGGNITSTNNLSRSPNAKFNYAQLPPPNNSIIFDHLAVAVQNIISGNKTTQYRGPFSFIFSPDPSNRRKGYLFHVNFDSGTQKVCKANGTSFAFFDEEQQFPVARIDNRDTTISSSVSVNQTPVETSTHQVFFTPTIAFNNSGNHFRVAFYCVSVGTGYTDLKIEIHNNANVPQGSVLFPRTSLVAGQWFYADLAVSLTPGAQYHYHVTTNGVAPSIIPTLGFGTQYNFKEFYKPSAGLYPTADAIKIIDASSVALAPTRLVGDDVVSGSPPSSPSEQTQIDIFPIDLSNNSFWDSFNEGAFIGIDPATGRIKLPAGYDVRNYFAEFNMLLQVTNLDAKGLLRESNGESVEDKLERLDGLENAAGFRQLGEIFWLHKHVDVADTFPAIDLASPNQDIDVANWPYLVPELRAKKLEYREGTVMLSQFNYSEILIESGFLQIYFPLTAQNQKLLEQLAIDLSVNGTNANWRTITLPALTINGVSIPAGEYEIWDVYSKYLRVNLCGDITRGSQAIASSSLGVGYEKENAFNDTYLSPSYWQSLETTTGVSGVSWIGQDFDPQQRGVVRQVKRVRLYGNAGDHPTSLKFQWSNDRHSWTDIDTKSWSNFASTVNTEVFDLSAYTAARYFRVLANSATTNNSNWVVNEMECFTTPVIGTEIGGDVTRINGAISGGDGNLKEYAFDYDPAGEWQSSQVEPAVAGAAYIGIDFGSGVTRQIKAVEYRASQSSGRSLLRAKIQWSSNGSTWTDIQTQYLAHKFEDGGDQRTIFLVDTYTAARYFRLLADAEPYGTSVGWGVPELYFYENPLMAQMRNVPVGSPKVLYTVDSAGITPANVFDRTQTSLWASTEVNPGVNGVSYIGLDLGAGYTKQFKACRVVQRTASNQVTSVKVQWSSNGSSWTDIQTQALNTRTSGQDPNGVIYATTEFDLAAYSAARYIRLLANSEPQGIGSQWQVNEIEFYENPLNYNTIGGDITVPWYAISSSLTGRNDVNRFASKVFNDIEEYIGTNSGIVEKGKTTKWGYANWTNPSDEWITSNPDNTSGTGGFPHWVGQDFGQNRTVRFYTYYMSSGFENGTKIRYNIRFQGSATGAWSGEEVTLDSRNNLDMLDAVLLGNKLYGYVKKFCFKIASPAAYRYYRLLWDYDDVPEEQKNYVRIQEMEMFDINSFAEFYPHRIKGQTGKARLFQIDDRVLMSAGEGILGGLRRWYTLGNHSHDLLYSASGGDFPAQYSVKLEVGTSAHLIGNSGQGHDLVFDATDRVDGLTTSGRMMRSAHVSDKTRPDALGAYAYIYGKRYNP